MKKYNKLLLVIALALYVPFSAIKTTYAASNIVYATGGTFTEGEYNVYTAQASSGGYLQFYAFDKYYSFDQYHSACIVKIDLNNTYSGDITLNFSSNYTMFPLWWAECEQGSCGIDGINKQIILHLSEVQSLTVYLCSTNTSSNGIQPTSIDSNLAVSSVYDDLLTFDIPLERTSAYSLLLNMGDKIHYDSSCPLPYIILDTSKSGQAWVYGGRTYLFAYAYDRSIGSKTFNQLFNVSYGNTYNTVSNNQSVAPTVSGGFVYDWVEITFNTGYNGWFTLTPNYNCRIVPLYFNLNNNTISTELAEFLHHDPNNITYNQLQQIIDNLVGNQSQADQDFIDDMTTTVNDYTASETTIHDFFDTSMNDIDLDDYSIPASLAATTQWLVSQMEDIFYEVPDLRILFVLPLVLGIALFFIGRGSVIFRQGNIDRAREVAYGDAVSAEVAKDNLNSQAMKGASARFGNNMRRMEAHHTHSFGYHERNYERNKNS